MARKLCGANTRRNTRCLARPVPGRSRCIHHGGLSTGPKTKAGKRRIAEAQRARLDAADECVRIALEMADNDPELQARLARFDAKALAGLAQRRLATMAEHRMNSTHRRAMRDFRTFCLEQGITIRDAGAVAAFLEHQAPMTTRAKLQRAFDGLCLARVAAKSDADAWSIDIDGIEPLLARLGLAFVVHVPRNRVPDWIIDGALNSGRLPNVKLEKAKC